MFFNNRIMNVTTFTSAESMEASGCLADAICNLYGVFLVSLSVKYEELSNSQIGLTKVEPCIQPILADFPLKIPMSTRLSGGRYGISTTQINLLC